MRRLILSCAFGMGATLLVPSACTTVGQTQGQGPLGRAGALPRVPSGTRSRSDFDFGYKTLYSFAGAHSGEFPVGGLTPVNGELFGTTSGGGPACGCGTVFTTALSGKTSIFYSFTGSSASSTSRPLATLLFYKGWLYGTTAGLGDEDHGTVFRLSLSAKLRILHEFSGELDGGNPGTPVIVQRGKFFGTTPGYDNPGSVFEVSNSGREHTLYDFQGGTDGGEPTGLVAVKRNLYGATFDGGSSGNGTIFEILANGQKQTVYEFEPYEGQGPEASMVLFDNMLYGTTSGGGTKGAGTVFFFDPVSHREQIIYSFTGSPADGARPVGPLIAVNGNFYGTTSVGGVSGGGTIFEVSPGGQERVLHNFTADNDGQQPQAGLTEFDGKLYGTTMTGGSRHCGCGTVFRINP